MDSPAPARSKQAFVISIPLFVIAALPLLEFHFWPHPSPPLLYKGRTFESWFYGSKTNFFDRDTREAAQKALWAMGTNAFPFLLDNLTHNRGCSRLYLKVYRAMPAKVQSRLPFPILGEDIKMWTWLLICNMPVFATEQVELLTYCIRNTSSPDVRLYGLIALHNNYRFESCFGSTCTNLLSDPAPKIRLQAAIFLAELTHSSQSLEPRVFPILLSALHNPPTGLYFDPELIEWIRTLLYNLKPYITDQQRARLNQVLPVLNESPTSRF